MKLWKHLIAINFVDFYGMMHSILRNWLKGYKRKVNESEINQCLLQNLLLQKQGSKWAYKKNALNLKKDQ